MYAVVEEHEFQRWYAILGWTDKRLPGDPSHLHYDTVVTEIPKQQHQGHWQYALSPLHWTDAAQQPGPLHVVRRRVNIVDCVNLSAYEHQPDRINTTEEIQHNSLVIHNYSSSFIVSIAFHSIDINVNANVWKPQFPSFLPPYHSCSYTLDDPEAKAKLFLTWGKVESQPSWKGSRQIEYIDIDWELTTDIQHGKELYIVRSTTTSNLKLVESAEFNLKMIFESWRRMQNQYFQHHEEKDVQTYFVRDHEEKDSLCSREADYVKERNERFVKYGLHDFVGEECENLRIGICLSGGGCRAMSCGLGFLEAANHTGLLDCVLYSSGLSGGAWLQTCWIEAGSVRKVGNWLREGLMQHIALPFDAPTRYELSWNEASLRSAFRPSNLIREVDIYGSLCAQQWFQVDSPLERTLSQQADLLVREDPFSIPFPIYCAVENSSPKVYNWFEFTPYEVCGLEYGKSIPTASFGRIFNEGMCVSSGPDMSLAALMGIWGSAFCATYSETLRNIGHEPLASSLLPLYKAIKGENERVIVPPRNHNFLPGIDNDLTLVDAGLCMNAPVPSLLRSSRNIDVIIIVDSRATDNDPKRSKDVLECLIQYPLDPELYSSLPGTIFTELDDDIGVNSITVFMPEDDQYDAPAIIYLPFVYNAEYDAYFDPATDTSCDFRNFKYSLPDLEKAIGLMRYNLLSNIDVVKDTLRQVAAAKSRID